ncbi:KUP/HAK/KT family potassium transporter [Dinghuibacter silviterrae]|uniref:Probable potassium transport system protein Kup n=1 Tax=Dinghuibacter silviterrae TaxID=1539049 RepID=A0A4R8DTY2_9BACT|nr:KUP/HAK/KT family potassium transporter [Dinghuibacter silviterrae]TDX01802.1 KUP system potassium uptake protein [Dinghuibacter silviterrae]
MDSSHSAHFKKASAAGLLVALGIIYGDIGTSPLYTFQTILTDGGVIDKVLIYGAISAIFWTLTLQTTFKYVIITLQADNKGEGGVFSLYALVRRYGKKLVYPAIIGAGTLLADGIITPPISITSAIEGLGGVHGLENVIVPGNTLVVEIVLVIILLLFIFQRFGTKVVGGSFGPIMLIWFTMLSVLGLKEIVHNPGVFQALSPHYAIEMLTQHPKGFWLLGSVFLCTTGAEALYSDLGHCGLGNIRVSWIFVKSCLVLNYLGQGAWVLAQHSTSLHGANPFFAIVPTWFLLPSILIATCASIIASQALISGSFTLISEAISLHFWPRVTVKFPTNIRGQIYIPSINWVLCLGCFLVVLYFRTSEAMTAAYGFSITVAMLMTTILMFFFLRRVKHWPMWSVVLVLVVFVTVESSFFVANAVKLLKRLFFLVFELGLISTMYIWYHARKITNRFLTFDNIEPYLPRIDELSKDEQTPKFSSQLIYLTKANNPRQIEKRILWSIFKETAKRADVYWFIHLERTDEPYTMAYGVEELKDDNVIRIDFFLGFRVQPRIGLMFRKVVMEMIANKELDITSRFPSLNSENLNNYKFVLMENFLSYDNEFSVREGFILNSYFALNRFALNDSRAFGLDVNQTLVEKIPLVVTPVSSIGLKRVFYRCKD